MKLTSLSRAICASALLWTAPLAAEDMRGMVIEDAYLRSSTPQSTSGAAFLMLMNRSGSDDRLIGAASDVAEKVELHSHTQDANGVMRMGEIEGGIRIANDERHMFTRGADHLMFMGLNRPLLQGYMIKVTLEFEKAGPVEVDIIVDQDRKPGSGKMDHGAQGAAKD